MAYTEEYIPGPGVRISLGGNSGGTGYDELVATSGCKIIVANGGFLTVDGNMAINGTWTAADGSVITFDEGSATTVSGASGNSATWGWGPYVSVGISGPSATWSFGQDSYTQFVGASGHVATFEINDYVAWTMNGSHSTFTMTSGTWSWNGGTFNHTSGTWTQSGGTENHSAGTFNINGATFNQSSNNNRTGADLPSGNGAYRGLRSDVTPAADANLSVKNNVPVPRSAS